jgi:hypothetical protein
MTQTQVAVSLTAFGFEPRPATALVIEQSTGERVARVAAGLGMFWALALGGLFIPVAHFVLVPVFLTAGAVTGIKRWFEIRRLAAVRGPCPRCGAQQTFKAGGRFEAGKNLDCPACHGTFALTLPGAATP